MVAGVTVEIGNLGKRQLGIVGVALEHRNHVTHVQTAVAVGRNDVGQLTADEDVASVVVGHRNDVLHLETTEYTALAGVALGELLELLAVEHLVQHLVKLVDAVHSAVLLGLLDALHGTLEHVAQLGVVLLQLGELLTVVAIQLVVDGVELLLHVLGCHLALHRLVDNVTHGLEDVLHEALLLGILNIVKIVAEIVDINLLHYETKIKWLVFLDCTVEASEESATSGFLFQRLFLGTSVS